MKGGLSCHQVSARAADGLDLHTTVEKYAGNEDTQKRTFLFLPPPLPIKISPLKHFFSAFRVGSKTHIGTEHNRHTHTHTWPPSL